MRWFRALRTIAVSVTFLATCALETQAASPQIGGCPVFPADNIWNVPIDTMPVHPLSDEYVTLIGREDNLHPDFGSGLWEGETIGIPFVTVSGEKNWANVSFEYADESDPGPYPIPVGVPIEGGPEIDGDRHVLVLDTDTCYLYELFYAFPQSDGSWTAGSGAIFNLNSHALRPLDWTSADAAGLPIVPGLIRYEEVAAGEITHAIRVTAAYTQAAYLWPARHFASDDLNPSTPPMGLRLRLRANYDISGYSSEVQVILRALKKYGMILADNGSPWFISGTPDERWDNEVLSEMKDIEGSAFEAVDVSSLMINVNSGQARTPGGNLRAVHSDFDGDRASDIVVWRPGNGYWFVLPSENGFRFEDHWAVQLGLPGDVPLSGDFDGDGKSDFVVWRPTDGNWYFRLSGYGYGSISSIQWGLPGDTPLVGDYDGDKRDELVVFRPSTGIFYALLSSGNFDRERALLGDGNAVYVVSADAINPQVASGDFSGDGADDFLAIWHAGEIGKMWTATNSSNQVVLSLPWGVATDTALVCDWDANEIADRIVVRENSEDTLEWYVATDTGPVHVIDFGQQGDLPGCKSDFNGDEKAEQSVFDPETGVWTIRNIESGVENEFQFGLPGDIPIS